MNREQAKALWEAAVTNNKRLNECARHLFVGELPPPRDRFQFKITCQRCGGSMRLTDVNQYIRGYIAHGGDGNEIWPGWS